MAMMQPQRLSGRQKVAALMIALGPDIAADLLKRLSEQDVEMVSREILNMQKVPSETIQRVVQEFYQLLLADEQVGAGGVDYARELLVRALGNQKGSEILERLIAGKGGRPFDFIRNTDPGQLLTYIQNEHPQTIALILSHLSANQAATILSALAPDLQAEVAHRVATMDRTSPEIIEQVEKALRKRLSSVISQDYTKAGGVPFLVNILNGVDRATERTILESLDETAPELADEIRKGMFTFDDLTLLDDRSLQRVLREVDMKDLTMALRGASEQVKQKVFRNVSKRAAETIQDDMTAGGPVRLRNVEEAQQRIVAVIRRLEEAEEIVVARGEEDVFV